MMATLICPDCNNRMTVDFRREFTQVRCDGCGKILERNRDEDKVASNKRSS